jgi:hypothetical protein
MDFVTPSDRVIMRNILGGGKVWAVLGGER